MHMSCIFIFIGHICSHWHLVCCFGEERAQEGPTEKEVYVVDWELGIYIKSSFLNVFKNQNRGQVTTALFFTSPKCKYGVGAISKCVVGKRDTTFSYDLLVHQGPSFEYFWTNEQPAYSNHFCHNPRLQLLSSEHWRSKASPAEAPPTGKILGSESNTPVLWQRLLLPGTEERMSKILDWCSPLHPWSR